MKNTVLFMLTFMFVCSANAEVKVIALDIPGLHQKDGKGAYDEVITKSVVNSGKAKIVILPPARAEAEFTKCTNCCLSPANNNPEFYDYGDEVVVTKPMDTAKVYIFTGKGKAVLSSLDSLKGKKVGARIGMPYGKTFDNSGIEAKLVSEIGTNIKKLDSGRIDAFIAYVPDAYIAFEKLNVPAYPHDKANPIAIHPDSLVCKGASKEFISTFNSSI